MHLHHRTDPTTRPTVLIEDPDCAVTAADVRAYERAGLRTVVCSGPPPGLGFDCPVVAGARCPMADSADVVLFAATGRTDRRLVLDEVRRTRPDVPILVEAPRPRPGHDDGLPPGCAVLALPSTRDEQIEAVRRAAASRAVR